MAYDHIVLYLRMRGKSHSLRDRENNNILNLLNSNVYYHPIPTPFVFSLIIYKLFKYPRGDLGRHIYQIVLNRNFNKQRFDDKMVRK